MVFGISLLTLLVRLAAASLLYFIAKCIYRITLHPLAKFPGPPLAAMTSIYAMTWDIPLETSYSKNFPKWHDKYGPIIRILPDQLHIRDMDAYNTVFKVGTKFNKGSAIYSSPLVGGSFFNKKVVRDGKIHRDLYVPYFSKANIVKMEHLCREHLIIFLDKLRDAYKAGKEVDLSLGYRCLTADTLTAYIYDKPYCALEAPDFNFPMIANMEGFFENAAPSWYFPNFFNAMVHVFLALPRSWVQFHKPISSAFANMDLCWNRISELKRESEANMSPSVFQTALHPRAEKGDLVLSHAEMAADAITMFTAGVDTTAHALVTGTWNMINKPEIFKKLQAALKEAIPDPENMNLNWAELEKIDYLRAVVKESIRKSYGAPGRLPREVPPGGATLVGQHIPGGTMISMATRVYHNHDPFFRNASDFIPERWLDEKEAAENEKNFVAFSRGSRNCIGMNLAYAELFYDFAYIFRRWEMQRAESMTDHDMQWHDAFVVATFGHLKVKLRTVEN